MEWSDSGMTANDKKHSKPGKPAARGIRQAMSDLHIWAGLLVGWILYAMFLTGTVSYFKEEISQWMRPEVAHQAAVPDAAEVVPRIAEELQQMVPGSSQWSLGMADARNNVVSAFWRIAKPAKGERGFGSAVFDPQTGQKVSSRETVGGEFFYRFHFQFHYMPVLWARWLASFCAMFMLVAIVSGVITHKKIFVDFFTFRWGKGQRSWLDAHNALSVFGLPFHAMITYTGLVTLMAMTMPWASSAAFKTQAERQAMQSEISAFVPAGKPSGQAVPLAPLGDMVRQAQERWGADRIGRVTVNNAGDASARVIVTYGDFERVSISPKYMLFEGSTGKLLEVKDQVGAAAETRGVLYALHLGRFGDTTVRWLYFLTSLAGTAMVGTGLVMWTVKRRTKLPHPDKPYFGFWLVERLNIAAIAGLSIGMAAMLWANRLLPLGMEKRSDWEIHWFFILWGASLVWAMLRPAKRAWVELLWAGCAALALLPVVNVLTTDRPLWRSAIDGDWVFTGLELTLLALAALHGWLAIRTWRHQPKRKPQRQAAPRPAANSPAPAARDVDSGATAASAAMAPDLQEARP
jgi:uncharacterized iron-regulated membrane protein